MNSHQIIREVAKVLSGNQNESEIIVLSCIQKHFGKKLNRSQLYLEKIEGIDSELIQEALGLAQKRARGESLQYLLGSQVFLDHEYEVDPNVLIPRPETEILVEEIFIFYKTRGITPTLGAEIGLGSGIISIELLSHFDSLEMIATEISENARQVAKRNLRRIVYPQNENRLQILVPDSATDVCSGLSRYIEKQNRHVDFLVSNPPYLKKSETTEEVLRNEPHSALFPEGDVLLFYNEIKNHAQNILAPEGVVFLEIPHERSDEIQALFLSEGWLVAVTSDLNLRDRVLVVTRNWD